jgi:ferredoxin
MRAGMMNNTSFFKGVVFVVSICALYFLVGCMNKLAPHSPAAGTYNETANATIYTVAPYGKVTLPGRWIPGKYNKTSKQQYYYREDTTTLTVAIGPCKSQPFGKNGLEGFDFVKRYYEMEANYQKQLLDQQAEILISDSAARYILWMVHQDGIDQYYLCGVKDCTCNVCVYRSFNLKNRRMSRADATKFLKDLYLASE